MEQTERTIHDPATQIVLAAYDAQSQANAAVDALRARGIPEAAISVALRDSTQETTAEELAEIDADSESTGTDVAIGSAAGGLLGFFAGMALFSIPGLGPFLGIGVLATTLGGAAAGSAFGERTGHLSTLGLPEDRAEHYHQALEAGRIVVAVLAADTTVNAVRDILQANGADNVDVHPYQAPAGTSPNPANEAL